MRVFGVPSRAVWTTSISTSIRSIRSPEGVVFATRILSSLVCYPSQHLRQGRWRALFLFHLILRFEAHACRLVRTSLGFEDTLALELGMLPRKEKEESTGVIREVRRFRRTSHPAGFRTMATIQENEQGLGYSNNHQKRPANSVIHSDTLPTSFQPDPFTNPKTLPIPDHKIHPYCEACVCLLC